MAKHKDTAQKTKIGQTDVSYNFGTYKVVIRNDAENTLHSVRARKIYWGPSHERLMQYNKNTIAVLKKMDRRSFPEKTYEIIGFRIAA